MGVEKGMDRKWDVLFCPPLSCWIFCCSSITLELNDTEMPTPV